MPAPTRRRRSNVNAFERSTWKGSRYIVRARVVSWEGLRWIFRCPLCEYGRTAWDREGIDVLRRTHVRTCHPMHVGELAALDTIDRVR